MTSPLGFKVGSLVTGRNEVVAKVMFLHVSVILFTGGGGGGGAIPACIAGGIPACLAAGLLGGVCLWPGRVSDLGGCLPLTLGVSALGPGGGGSTPGPRGICFWSGVVSRPTAKGEIEGDLVQAHSQGGNLGGSGLGPQPRGKFRGIWFRPTTKGEVQGTKSRPPPYSQ